MAVCLFLGFTLGADPGARDLVRSHAPEAISGMLLSQEEEGTFPLQDEVLHDLENVYYQVPDIDTLEEGAVRGMLGTLEDGYTSYLDPEQYGLLMEHTEGSYSGVGMVVEMKGRFVTVVSTFAETSAQESGMRPGDLILGVDDSSTQGLSLMEVVTLIKGEEGTDAILHIYRPPACPASHARRPPPTCQYQALGSRHSPDHGGLHPATEMSPLLPATAASRRSPLEREISLDHEHPDPLRV